MLTPASIADARNFRASAVLRPQITKKSIPGFFGPGCGHSLLLAVPIVASAKLRRKRWNTARAVSRPMTFRPEDLAIVTGSGQHNYTKDGSATVGGWLPLFRGSAPYVAMFRSSTMVFHVPGSVLDPSSLSDLEGLLNDLVLCSLLGVRPVLVLSVEQRFLARLENASRARDPCSSMEVMLKQETGFLLSEVETLLCHLGSRRPGGPGVISDGRSGYVVESLSQICTAVQALDVNAGELPPAWNRAAHLLGRVRSVDVQQLTRRLHQAEVLCLTSIGVGANGEVFHVPSEELAAVVASQLKAAKLIYFTTCGQQVIDKSKRKVVAAMQLKEATEFMQYATSHPEDFKDKPSAETLTYLQLLLHALQGGTRRGHLIELKRGALLQELYTVDGSGMMISQDLYDGIRQANSSDVPSIIGLIEPLARAGLLKRRTNYEVESACNKGEFYVWKRDADAIACASLQRYDDGPSTAELGCFVVSSLCRSKGHGAVLLSYMERIAAAQGLKSIFLLTTQTMQWFVERGFKEASVRDLPPSKQEKYDVSRSSKVYIKSLDDMPSEVQERFTFVEVEGLD